MKIPLMIIKNLVHPCVSRLFITALLACTFNTGSVAAQNLDLDSDGEVNSIASDILKGGYILFFRHASKQKIGDFYLLDQLAAYTRNTMLDGTCLSPEGEIESKAIGAMLAITKMNIGKVYASPMCRSKQTAELSMGRVDEISDVFYYPSLLSYDKTEAQKDLILVAFADKMKEIMPATGEGNALVFAHNSTIESSFYSNIIDDSDFEADKVDSGGFHVLKVEEDVIKLIYSFSLFHEFSWEVTAVPIPK